MIIDKKVGGIRLVADKTQDVRSVTLGVWIKAGSVFESDKNNGISHFIEHMLFKGTKKRNYKQLAEEIDNIGGQMNAFTSKECTCYYAKVIDEHQDIAADVLFEDDMDLMFRAAIECVEESVISSLTHAEHTKGFRGHEKECLAELL